MFLYYSNDYYSNGYYLQGSFINKIFDYIYY